MINNEIYKDTNILNLPSTLINAIDVMKKSTNKLILILRDKTNAEFGKSIAAFSRDNQIARINLGLQMAKYLFENNLNSVNNYLAKELNTGKPLIVDNAEILFDSEIATNAFTLLENIARHQVIIAVLDGRIVDGDKFIYGSSSNQDFFQYEKLADIYIINLSGEEE